MKEPLSPDVVDGKIITPPKDDFPPQNPNKVKLPTIVTSSYEEPYLPNRQWCDYYVARFFEEVHCIYWLYPVEQFHARLDETYFNVGEKKSSSWLCSLYSIFALGAASGLNPTDSLFNDIVSRESQIDPDTKTWEEYLVLAKALVPAVHDEADIDSIRALAILVSGIHI